MLRPSKQPALRLENCLQMRHATLTSQIRNAPGLMMLAAFDIGIVLDPVGFSGSAAGAALGAIIAGVSTQRLLPSSMLEIKAWRKLAEKRLNPETLRLALLNQLALTVETAALVGFVLSSILLLGAEALMAVSVPMKLLYFFMGYVSAAFSFAGLLRYLSATSTTESFLD